MSKCRENEGRKGRSGRSRIQAGRLLFVEGKDEVRLFTALIENHLHLPDFQVVDLGGKDRFSRRLQAISTELITQETILIGVVRDADDNPKAAFQSVCAQLRNVGYVPPENHAGLSDASPAVGVFIVPDGDGCGAIETLCRRSVEDSNAAWCVERYLECLEKRGAMESANPDKSFAHAYLASRRDPSVRVGEGADRGIWNFGSEAFRPLVRFIRALRGSAV